MKLKNELLPHQIAAVEKLRKLKVGALFMEQGTGKTITALELCRLRLALNRVDRIIWLCPCSAKHNIKSEILKQAPDTLASAITICGIETLSTSIRANLYLRTMASTYRCYLIIDESLLIKNIRAYRTKNIIELANFCQYKLLLNGTPISKDECDLFAQFFVLDWRILGYKSFWSFAANHIEYDKDTPDKIVKILNTDYLIDRIQPYVFEVKKSDCLKLPSKHYKYAGFYLNEEQFEHYFEIADALMFELDEFHPETVYRFLSALQAIMSGKRVLIKTPRHYITEEFFSSPIENPRILTLLNNVPDEKTIIFCNYSSEISDICSLLNNSVRFDGSVNMKTRMKNLEYFKNEAKYLVANRSCAGYSLNLQFCSNIIYYSNNWNLATRLQSEDRVHRIGQENPIDIMDIYAYDTLDERISNCLYRKENLLEHIKEMIKNNKGKDISEWLYTNKTSGYKNMPQYDCSNLLEDIDA